MGRDDLPYMHLAERYQFLDLVVSYTMYDECCCYFCSIFDNKNEGLVPECECKDCQPYLDKLAKYSWHHSDHGYNREPSFEELYFRSWETGHVRSDVGDSVVLTIWIHDGRTDIPFGGEAADKYREYNELYCAPEYAFMFSSELYSSGRTCICSKTFVEDCFEYIGKPRSLYDEYVERGFLSPFQENAIVVTKEWVARQYNAIEGNSVRKSGQ